MTYVVIQPPQEEKELAEVGKQIVEAAHRLGGVKLNPEGLLFAWISGTRVVVKRDESDTIVGLALMTVGHRWLHDDFTATVLLLLGERDEMLNFLTTIANALGATNLYYEEREPLEVTPRYTRSVVRKVTLQ